jgi:HEAT repeat protein
MQALTLFVLATLCAAPGSASGDDGKAATAVAALDKAFKDGDKSERLKAIQEAVLVADAAVVERIARALRDREPDVQKGALEALRYVDRPEAVQALNDAAKRDVKLHRDPELYACLLRAIGQHGDASSLDALAEDIWTAPEPAVLEARVLGLARIRGEASVAKLMDALRTAGASRVQPYMPDFRLALMVLTGVDQGTSPDLWLRWWNENRAKLRVEKKPLPLPKAMQLRWDAYWGDARYYDRPTARAERGKGDPPAK